MEPVYIHMSESSGVTDIDIMANTTNGKLSMFCYSVHQYAWVDLDIENAVKVRDALNTWLKETGVE